MGIALKFFSLDKNTAPDIWIAEQVSTIQRGAGASACQAFAFHFAYSQTYLPGQPVIELLALIHVNCTCSSVAIHLSIFPFSAETVPDIELLPDDLVAIRQFAARNHYAVMEVSAPWLLDPVYIPKPWGQEIWFTGIEARGQAAVKGEGGNLPLSWVLALFPQVGQRPLVLLKVLDPLPDEVYGDLYFELHEEKQEVYVVTGVDKRAWPDGTGAIQLGFSSGKRREYTNDDEFKQAYLAAVKEYEQVRRAVDKKLDELRVQEHIGLDSPVSAGQLKKWVNKLSQSIESKELIQSEKTLRQAMNSFVNQLPLAVGDTLAIPRNVPHALQHGVRVVEFQTPVYERKILSFAQKVLTQHHWDTDRALATVDLDCVSIPHPEVLFSNDRVKVEQIVSFDDFLVQRINLGSGTCELMQADYSLVMPITGELSLVWGNHHQVITAGEVILLPGAITGCCRFMAADSCLFLYAIPKAFDKA